MFWKNKTDLFASVAMYGAAPSGGAANAGGPGGLGGPGAGQASDQGPSGDATGGIGPGPSSGRGDGGGMAGRQTAQTTPTQQFTRTLTPELTTQGRQQGVQTAEQTFDDIVSNAIADAQSNFQGAAEQRGLSMEDTTRPGGRQISDLFQQSDVRGQFEQPDNFGQFVSPGVGERTETITAPEGSNPDLQGTFQTDEFDVDRSGIRSAAGQGPGENFGSNVLNQARERARNELGQEINEFASPGFEQNLIGEDFGQSAVDEILNQRFRDAQGIVENAGARGQINDQGFDRGMQALQGQRGEAQSRLSDIRGNLRSEARQDLRSAGEQARERASNFQLGQQFDPEDVQSRIESIRGEATGNVAGDVRSNLGEAPLFQTSDAITQAGIAQGQANPGRQSLVGALANRDRSRGANRNAQRGLGTQGAF